MDWIIVLLWDGSAGLCFLYVTDINWPLCGPHHWPFFEMPNLTHVEKGEFRIMDSYLVSGNKLRLVFGPGELVYKLIKSKC